MPSEPGQALPAMRRRIWLPPRWLARAAQPARGMAGHGAALHAELADFKTLVELSCVVVGETLGNADALLGRRLHVLRTGSSRKRRENDEDDQANQTSQSHAMLPLLSVSGPRRRMAGPSPQDPVRQSLQNRVQNERTRPPAESHSPNCTQTSGHRDAIRSPWRWLRYA